MDAREPREPADEVEGLTERAQLVLECSARPPCIEPDLPDDRRPLRELAEAARIESRLSLGPPRMAAHAPGDKWRGAIDDGGRLVEGEGHREDGPRVPQLLRGPSGIHVGVEGRKFRRANRRPDSFGPDVPRRARAGYCA